MMDNIFRFLFFFFDSIIYRFIPILYDFTELLARQQVISSENIESFANNIYALLGIFMLFRLAFILLNAIIDPDKLNNEKGFTKIVTRIIQALFLIVIIPYAFEYAYSLQNNIIDIGIMTKVFFGGQTVEAEDAGNVLAQTTLNSFYRCRDDLLEAKTDPTDSSRTIMVCKDEGRLNDAFSDAFPSATGSSPNFSSLREILNTKASDGEYFYEYNSIISTISGGLILFLLITFTIDVAVRAVKLSFLQLITPVAVIGYIEPGGGIFKTWLKMVVATFVNLFIRLLALSFVGYIMSLLTHFNPVDKNGLPLTGTLRAFVYIMIIIGALIFAKEAPKILSKLFNIDEGSLGSLNPLKKLGGVAGAGLIGAGAAVGAKLTGATFGGISGGIAARSRGGSFLAGAAQGAKTGFGNVKVKDGYKGGVTGLGKTLLGGTFGASSKGGSYAASKVTGNEDEKVGLAKIGENIKDGLSCKTASMHEKRGNRKAAEMYEELSAKQKRGESIYKNADYQTAVNHLADSKEKLKQFEAERQYWANRYQTDPTGVYKGADGKEYEIRTAYETANKNYVNAQKNTDYYKTELEEMDKEFKYSEDAATRKFMNDYKEMQKYSTVQKVDPIPGQGNLEHVNQPKTSGHNNEPKDSGNL